MIITGSGLKNINFMKRILFIASEYALGMMPFAATIINSLTESEDFEVYSILVSRKDRQYKTLISPKAQNNTVFVQASTGNIISRVLYKMWPSCVFRAYNDLIKKHDFDYVHFLTVDYTLSLYVLTHSYKFKNLVYTVHDAIPHEREAKKPLRQRLFFSYVRLGYLINAHLAKRLTTSSHMQIDYLTKRYTGKVTRYTNFPSLITDTIVNGTVTVPELKEIKDYILFFGAVNKYKGVDYLLEAFRKVASTLNCDLVVAGCGVQYFNTDMDRKEIRINRYFNNEEVRNLIEKAAILVYPYRSATMSGVLSLSYYFKKPIVVSDVPFFLDNVGNSAYIFEKGNIDDLAKKITLAFKQRKIDDYYEKNYSMYSLVESYRNLYSD